MAPAMARECLLYCTHIHYTLNNIYRATSKMRTKGYPHAWWANIFLHVLMRYGLNVCHMPRGNAWVNP